MAKKSRKPRSGKPRSPAPPTPVMPAMQRTTGVAGMLPNEQFMTQIQKLLQEREFDSIEEINAFLQQTINAGQLPAKQLATPEEQAQDLIYQAYEATGKRRTTLARQALALWPDCADAYVILGGAAKTPAEAKQLYEQGVTAGQRALGPERFANAVGHFWGIIETRPYMRARAELAGCLWYLGKRDEAIAHYQDMLRLNPGDNQGVRSLLANCLAETQNTEALGRLLAAYADDATADWAYSRALWLFQTNGKDRKATQALQQALQTNPYVPLYVLNLKPLPRALPAYVGFGDENEAISYATGAIPAWHTTKGAADWMAETLSHEIERGRLAPERKR